MPETYLNSPKVTPAIPPAKPIAWTAVVIAAIAAGTIIQVTSNLRQEPPSRPAVAPAAISVATPTPAAPAPVVIPDPPVQRAVVPEPIVRRGDLVGLPINTVWRLQMPCDGHIINVVYRGEVPSFGDLPRNPGANDMYKVTESGHAWVWYQLSNFSHMSWVDP